MDDPHLVDTHNPEWVAQSTVDACAEVEILFYLPHEFVVHGNNPDTSPKISLPTPRFPCATPDWYSSTEVLGHECELITYYQKVLDVAAEHAFGYDDVSAHFWLNLSIGSKASNVGFPWYDHYHECEGVLSWLETAKDGEIYHDVDQGWENTMIAKGRLIHVREWDPEEGAEYLNKAFYRQELLVSVAALRNRMRSILPKLVSGVGEDYWTKFRFDLSRFF